METSVEEMLRMRGIRFLIATWISHMLYIKVAHYISAEKLQRFIKVCLTQNLTIFKSI